MKLNKQIILVFILGISSFLCFSVLAGKEETELKFSHKLHAIENEIECATCHATAGDSKSGTDNLMPDMEVCGACHDVEDVEQCNLCHSDPENPRAVPRVIDYFPIFSHRMHTYKGMECVECHKAVIQKEEVEPYILPDQKNCQTCHQTKKVKPKTHGAQYYHLHGDDAKGNSNMVDISQTCNVCHTERYCQYCHEGDNLDRVTHPLNYAFTHSLDARGKERECAVCHMERSFCEDCHRENMIAPHNHYAGWALVGSGGRHVDEARNDLENCMSCHTHNAEQTCQKSGCHLK